MTAEEVFCELSDKYGDDFNWHMLPLSNHTFTAELKKKKSAIVTSSIINRYGR